ncbi:JAB domain-containing protein [Sphingomonas sp.]|jgi:DNA repair protein RadC|uniref:JAB domain-containing protein n=1 Tax=Sphingomonas sp. TaxID=28214 RepID=UPI002ED8FFB2
MPASLTSSGIRAKHAAYVIVDKYTSGSDRIVFRRFAREWQFALMAPVDPLLPQQRLADPAAAEAFFLALADEAFEVAAFAYLDANQQLLGLRHARSTSADRLDLPIRAIAADALAFDAVGVVMAHNHPSGDCTPSAADREATRMLARALDGLGIRLLDHLVISRSGVASFRALGLL